MGDLFIGALSKRSGVPVKTIRYYEELGLIRPRRRTRGGFRVYDESLVFVLQFIRHAQRLGFSLREIRQVLRAWKRTGSSCGAVRVIAERKLERVEEVLKRLRALQDRLRRLVDALREGERCEEHNPHVCTVIMETFPLPEPLTPLLADWTKPRKRQRPKRVFRRPYQE